MGDFLIPRCRFVVVNPGQMSKEDKNKLIAEYLFKEGYYSIAKKFLEEANVNYDPSCFPFNQEREQIIKSCHSGQIDVAIEIMMRSFPQAVRDDPQILFIL